METTERSPHCRRSVLPIAALLAALLAGCASPGGVPGGPIASLPPEIDQLRLTVEPTVPAAAVSEAEAIAKANAENGFDRAASSINAYLLQVTDPASTWLLTRRPVWVIYYRGVTIAGPSGNLFHSAFVFVDANTGEFLMNAFAD